MDKTSHHGFSWHALGRFLRERFDLQADGADQREVEENICRGAEFRGMNLWVLIFATFVASLGLNVNSTAVIIGAMLISPLMGPIMGMGFSVGINDFDLLKRSLRNFGFMVLVSILTSTFYFFVSPLSGAQSELLARTVPTTYDVLIAFFGGLAGIVAQSRRDRTSTVVPGVAIATALMPPLCTAGYGLATWQLQYFIGAFYLFFINTVFIALATYVVVRFLKYRKKTFIDKARERRVQRSMVAIMLVAAVPSVFVGYRIVKRSYFEASAARYVQTVFQFPKAKAIDFQCEYTPDSSRIEVFLIGEPISEELIENARMQLEGYGLGSTRLVVRQSGESGTLDFRSLQYDYRELLDEKNRRLSELEKRIATYTTDTLAAADIAREMRALVPSLQEVSLSRALRYRDPGRPDTVVICVMKTADRKPLSSTERNRVEQWLRTRTKTDSLKLYTE